MNTTLHHTALRLVHLAARVLKPVSPLHALERVARQISQQTGGNRTGMGSVRVVPAKGMGATIVVDFSIRGTKKRRMLAQALVRHAPAIHQLLHDVGRLIGDVTGRVMVDHRRVAATLHFPVPTSATKGVARRATAIGNAIIKVRDLIRHTMAELERTARQRP